MRLRTQWRDRDAKKAKSLAKTIVREEHHSVKAPAKNGLDTAGDQKDASSTGGEAPPAYEDEDYPDIAEDEDLIDLGPSKESSPQPDGSEDLINFDED
jgi:hypothetical protein